MVAGQPPVRETPALYSTKTGMRATRGKGVGAVISDDLGRAARKAASLRNSYDRRNLSVELEPLEERRAAIETELIELDKQKLETEKWISAHKAGAEKRQSAPKKAAPQPAAAGDADVPVAQLEQLASLKERGILTEAEFETEKQRILDREP